MSFRAQMIRLNYIDSRLRSRQDYPTAVDIARGLREQHGEEPSDRTIKRDIEKMRGQGAPISYDRSRGGYYYEHENWQLPAISLSEGDLMALMVADRALAGYRNSPYYQELQAIFDRLTQLLPAHVSVTPEKLGENVMVITDPVTRIRDGVWEVVRTGMHEHRSIAIHYLSPMYEQSAVRIIDPLHMIGHHGEWYLLCWSHHHNQIRIYALNRVQEARVRPERFTRPEGFRVEDYIDPSFGIFVNESAVDAAVRFTGDAASKIPERQWHPGQQVEYQDDGSIVVRFRTNQQSQLLFWVSQWGPQAEILEPAGLRQRAREWFSSAAANYR